MLFIGSLADCKIAKPTKSWSDHDHNNREEVNNITVKSVYNELPKIYDGHFDRLEYHHSYQNNISSWFIKSSRNYNDKK